MMIYEDAMKYINEVGKLGSCYGLERTYRILEILNNPQNDYKTVHIAGTNGKGSTTSIITSLLMGEGYRVGMYTSPYLEEFEERIQINRVNIPQKTLGLLMDKIKNAVDLVVSEGFSHPTEFEIITCLMFLYFSMEKVDYAVIEVGLGGRLDSTNVIIPVVSIITSISFDHTNILGNTLSEIAGEKAGIIKERIPVICYPQQEEALNVIKNKAFDMTSTLIVVDVTNGRLNKIINDKKYYQQVTVNLDGDIFDVNFPLLGEHQINNLMLALKAFKLISEIEGIKMNKNNIKKAIASVKWIGRLEVMNTNPLVVIDGAHNLQGIKALKDNVEKYFKYENIYLLLGILADKDVQKMIQIITPNVKKVYALTPHSDRAELCEDLKKEILKYNKNCDAYESYEEAFNLALKDASQNDIILISGSLYMVGDMRKIIRKSLIQ